METVSPAHMSEKRIIQRPISPEQAKNLFSMLLRRAQFIPKEETFHTGWGAEEKPMAFTTSNVETGSVLDFDGKSVTFFAGDNSNDMNDDLKMLFGSHTRPFTDQEAA